MILRVAFISVLVLALTATTSRTHANAAASVYCPPRTVAWVYAVSDLNSDLDVGVSYNEYGQRLRAILRLYHRSVSHRDSLSCLRNVSVPAENAMNHYSTAYRVWAWCIDHLGCDANHEAQRQRQWSTASAAINRATNNLD